MRPFQPGDLAQIVAQGLRKSDNDEIEGLGQRPFVALSNSIQSTAPHCMTVVAGDLPVAVFGAAEVRPGVGTPWFLATDGIYLVSREFAKQTQSWVNWMNAQFPFLMNLMSDDNRVSKRWLRNAGFTIHPPKPIGVDGKLYCPFTRRRS